MLSLDRDSYVNIFTRYYSSLALRPLIDIGVYIPQYGVFLKISQNGLKWPNISKSAKFGYLYSHFDRFCENRPKMSKIYVFRLGTLVHITFLYIPHIGVYIPHIGMYIPQYGVYKKSEKKVYPILGYLYPNMGYKSCKDAERANMLK